MKWRPWDELVLKVDDEFGYKDKVISHLKVMILGIEVNDFDDVVQCLCYVPPYERVPYGFKTFAIDRHHQRHFRFDPKFVGDVGCLITSNHPIHKRIAAPLGERCDHCNDFHEGATRSGEGTYLCRACRENPYR